MGEEHKCCIYIFIEFISYYDFFNLHIATAQSNTSRLLSIQRVTEPISSRSTLVCHLLSKW